MTAELPEEVYRDAAVAFVEAGEYGGAPLAKVCQADPLIRAAVESAYRAGRVAAVAEFRAWLDYRGLPQTTSLKELIETERAGAALAAVFDAIRDGHIDPKATQISDPLDHVVAHHEDRTHEEIADVKRDEDQ